MSSQLARDWIRSLYNAVHAPASSAVYPCFTDPALENSGHAYHGQDRERRNAIKPRYDPDNFFRFDNRSGLLPGRALTVLGVRTRSEPSP
jgi:hypothetical protein